MATVIVTLDVQGTTAVTAPAGTTLGGLSVSISGNPVPAQVVTTAPWSVSFANVPAGTYSASVQGIDANGKPLGASVSSAQFTVEPDVSIDIPNVVSVAVQVQ
ncbi:hypothetical protein AB4Y43_01520 [Paraburkholderia sp. BR10872]|uniref:hypothetical protein n=1 Tax=Paraburkholderia sp. BR10872 TaxID=3236989 RepID=UPI0034D198F6